jgi:hypothetical protein
MAFEIPQNQIKRHLQNGLLFLVVIAGAVWLRADPRNLLKPLDPVPNEAVEADKKNAQKFRENPPERETVMAKGMKITAVAPIGKMTIEAGDGFQRIYTWENCTREADLWPRAERWYGSYGIYSPGPEGLWENCNGIRRGVLEEGQQNFKNIDEVLAFVRKYKEHTSPKQALVYNNQGLFIYWAFEPQRNQINVDVWQLMVNGKKTYQIDGAKDDAIVVSRK